MVYDRNRDQGGYYGRRETQDYGRDYGSGRDYSYSSARDYAAAGEYGRGGQDDDGRRSGNDFGRDQDRHRGDDRYGQREYGNAGYASQYRREERGYGGQARGNYGAQGQGGYGAEWNDRDDRGGRNGGQGYGQGRNQDRFQQQQQHRGGGDYGRQPQGYDYDERGFLSRAGDEVRSWFGDDEAERRREMDARYDERSYGGRAASDRDDHYHSWRRSQIDALDRDYDEYRREHRSKFENEFSTWRSGRQGQRDLLNKVEEHMDVVGSDGTHVGTVDKVRGDRILLAKNDTDSGGRHHSIPSSWLQTVDTKVTLSKTADEAKRQWRDEERNQAMFGDHEENGGRDAQGRILNRSFSGTY